jgi:PhzF family phenazine biosynthesis protein
MSRRTGAQRNLPLFHIDAFTDRLFAGNPAAVVPLQSWLPARVMQTIAAENNLSETAFFVPVERRKRDGDKTLRFKLRWFTPKIEVPLCGHATLASGWLVLEHLHRDAGQVVFETASGPLTVTRQPNGRGRPLLQLDFPALPANPVPRAVAAKVAAALPGTRPVAVLSATKMMAVMADADAVRRAQPNFDSVKALPARGLIITAAADASDRPADFVSRYFAPHAGIEEDPVTGSAHCTLVPYWSERLGKSRLHTRQISPRGGELRCALIGDRVTMAGHAAPYLEGTIRVG